MQYFYEEKLIFQIFVKTCNTFSKNILTIYYKYNQNVNISQS